MGYKLFTDQDVRTPKGIGQLVKVLGTDSMFFLQNLKTFFILKRNPDLCQLSYVNSYSHPTHHIEWLNPTNIAKPIISSQHGKILHTFPWVKSPLFSPFFRQFSILCHHLLRIFEECKGLTMENQSLPT